MYLCFYLWECLMYPLCLDHQTIWILWTLIVKLKWPVDFAVRPIAAQDYNVKVTTFILHIVYESINSIRSLKLFYLKSAVSFTDIFYSEETSTGRLYWCVDTFHSYVWQISLHWWNSNWHYICGCASALIMEQTYYLDSRQTKCFLNAYKYLFTVQSVKHSNFIRSRNSQH